jgi:hypothetical protein
VRKRTAVPEGGSSGTAQAGGQASSYPAVMPLRPHGRQFTDLVTTMRSVTKERRWLFEGAIEGNPIAVMAGPEKTSKSWAMMQCAVACATGGSWLGAFPCARPGPVIYLDSEYGEFEFGRRLARLCRGMGHDPEQVAPRIHHYYAVDLRLGEDNEAANWVMRNARTIQPRVIVIDPWRNAIDGEENNAQDTIDSLEICSKFRDATGAAVMIAHHLNKNGVQSGSRALMTRADLLFEGSDELEPWYRSRGRTIRRGDAINKSFTIGVEHEDDEDDTVAKTLVRLRFEGESQAAPGDLSKPALRVLAILKECRTARTLRQLRGELDVNDSRMKGYVAQLVKAGLASWEGEKVSLPTPEFFRNLGGENDSE